MSYAATQSSAAPHNAIYSRPSFRDNPQSPALDRISPQSGLAVYTADDEGSELLGLPATTSWIMDDLTDEM